nr:arginase family protein [Mycolicibacterium elephantis]
MDLSGEAWRAPLDRSSDPHREPGPINLQRYQFTPAYAGIATLFGLPLCLNQDDLRAGAVDVAVLGAPVDMSMGHRGAAFGPRRIRADERVLAHSPRMLVNDSTRVHPFEVLTVVDYGDAPVDPLSIENSMEPIRRLIDDEHIPGRNFIQIGLRSAVAPDDALFEWMRENGLRTHFMAEIDRRGFHTVLEQAISEALDGPEYLYLSLDIDVLDPAFAPGTGTLSRPA